MGVRTISSEIAPPTIVTCCVSPKVGLEWEIDNGLSMVRLSACWTQSSDEYRLVLPELGPLHLGTVGESARSSANNIRFCKPGASS